jgi:hypothetical protein
VYLAGFLLGAFFLLTVANACSGDDGEFTATPSPSASELPDDSPQVAGVEAARQFLQKTGIEGKKGNFTDPRACTEITGDTQGKFCVHEDFSTYAPGLMILRLAEARKRDEKVWEMRLVKRDGNWSVTDVQPFGGEE